MLCVALASCSGGDNSTRLKVKQSCDGAIGLDGACTDLPPGATVYSIDSSDVTLDATSDVPDAGTEVPSGDSGVAEACCVFAVWGSPGLPYYQDVGGNYYFTGACPLPYPWTPGAFGCTCLGNNAVVDPYTGYAQPVWANWNGFTCIVD